MSRRRSHPAGVQRSAVAVRVEGLVQGVGFRYTTLHQARRLRLSGYVRNLPNGMVEVVAEGAQADVERLKTWLKRGPTGAYVRRVEVSAVPCSGLYRDFSVEY